MGADSYTAAWRIDGRSVPHRLRVPVHPYFGWVADDPASR